MTELSTEDAKLVTLARGSRARISAAAGAAVRDEVGRSYTAADVTLATGLVSALTLAVASAVAAGAKSLEAAVYLGDGEPDDAVLAGLGNVRLLTCAVDGTVRSDRHVNG